MDQRHRLDPVVDLDTELEHDIVQGVHKGVTGPIGRKASPPFPGPAEVPGGDETFHFEALVDYPAVNEGSRAGHDAGPGTSPVCHPPHSRGSEVNKEADDVLVTPPVGALHRVLEVGVD